MKHTTNYDRVLPYCTLIAKHKPAFMQCTVSYDSIVSYDCIDNVRARIDCISEAI
jgi:hypothetical protein